MANFRIVISDPKTGKSVQREVTDKSADSLIGKKIGEIFEGSMIGLDGYKLKITGGTDKDGFPMSPKIQGGIRKAVLLSSGFGFHPKKKGMRKKKMLRGNTITGETVQINTVIVEYGEKPLIEEKKEEGQP
ncbi:MAG: 30S ribosomal protein S6e [Thermoplasmata archaeon]